MCPPVMATLAAASPYITAATAAVTAVTGYQGAKTQARYQEQLGVNANIAASQQATQANLREVQARASEALKLSDKLRESRRAEAVAVAAAGEAGVGGLSVDNLIANFERNRSRYRDISEQQDTFRQQELSFQKDNINATRDSRLAEARRPIDNSYIGQALSIAGSAGSQYAAAKKP